MTYNEVQLEVAKVYAAAFDRAPEREGLLYWTEQVNNGNLTIEQVAESFYDQPEFKNLYDPENSTDEEYVTAIYEHVFDRTPSAEEVGYWVSQLQTDGGPVTRKTLTAAMVHGALGDDATQLANQAEVGVEYALHSAGIIEAAKAAIDGVTADPATVEQAIDAFESKYGYRVSTPDDLANLSSDITAVNLSNAESGTYDFSQVVSENLNRIAFLEPAQGDVNLQNLPDNAEVCFMGYDMGEDIGMGLPGDWYEGLTFTLSDLNRESNQLTIDLYAHQPIELEDASSPFGVITVKAHVDNTENIVITSNLCSDLSGDQYMPQDYTNGFLLDSSSVNNVVLKGESGLVFEVTEGAQIHSVDASDIDGHVDVFMRSNEQSVEYIGSSGADFYFTSDQGDNIEAGGGADYISLGDGMDTVIYRASTDTPVDFIEYSDGMYVRMEEISSFETGVDKIVFTSDLNLVDGEARESILQKEMIDINNMDAYISANGNDFFDDNGTDRVLAWAVTTDPFGDASDGCLFVDVNGDGDLNLEDDISIRFYDMTTFDLADVVFV